MFKRHGIERIGKGKIYLSVKFRKAERKSLRLPNIVKTRVLCGFWDKYIGYLFTGYMAIGVEVTGVRNRLGKGTGESCLTMINEKYKLTYLRV